MSKIKFLTLLTLITTNSIFGQIEKTNVLFIAADDLNTHLGYMADELYSDLHIIYKNPKVLESVKQRLSPNLDKLAGQSIRFKNAYTASPLCGPSRAALLLGIRPDRTGIYGNQTHFRDIEELKDRTTLPEHFKNNGFFTAGVGKIFHTPNSRKKDFPDSEKSWSKWVPREVGAAGKFSKRTEEELKWIGALDVPNEDTADWQNASFIAELLTTRKASIEDIDHEKVEIELPTDRPFFLAYGVFRPHIPFYVPKKYYDAFPIEEMEIDESTIDFMLADMDDVPMAGKKMSGLHHGIIKIIFETIGQKGIKGGRLRGLQRLIQAYLASVKYADECIGKVLAGLEKSEFANNTMVVLWSDHGWHTTTKFTFDKLTLWEGATRSVFLMRKPGQKNGADCNSVVSLLDIYPTLNSQFGLPAIKDLDGDDISRLLTDPGMAWEHPAVSTWGEGNHMIRTQRFKYIRYRDASEELYNLQSDPFEILNLSRNPNFHPLMFNLERKLDSVLDKNKPLVLTKKNKPSGDYKKW